jgi:hypothetical protein
MKNVAIAAITLLLCVAAVGCATPRISLEDGFGVQFEPAVALSRLQEGEKIQEEAILALAEKVEGGEKIAADLEEKSEELKEKDITDSEWFWLLLAAAGIPLVKPTARAGKRGVGALAKLIAPLPTPPSEPPAPVAS